MTILTIRTDKPEAELALYDGATLREHDEWTAHRQLAETLHARILDLLKRSGLTLTDVEGIACFQGPGSFTGLRIGLTVANALSYSLQAPIVAATGDDWQQRAIERLLAGDHEAVALPEYGADVHITPPKTSRPA